MMVDLVAGELDRVHERIGCRFGRAMPRAAHYISPVSASAKLLENLTKASTS